MGAVFLNSFSPPSAVALDKVLRVCDDHKRNWCLLKRKRSVVLCQGSSSGNVVKTGGFSSAAVMDAGSLSNIAVKDLVPFGRSSSTPTTSLVDMHDGIGIVKFLKRKGKILRTAPDVGKIFLLIKAKNKEAAMERLKTEIINAELFKCLRQTYGKSYQSFMLSKLFPVVGNACESDLGIEDDVASLISKEVDVIVNCAANTTFHERYDVGIDINTKGPCHLMAFAKKCKKLKLFLQVSTAYVNGQRQGRIMEKPFCIRESIAGEKHKSETPPGFYPLDVENEINLASNSKGAYENNEVAQKMKELGLERARKYGWQDTYVFTKAMGEMMINNMRGDTPVVMIRPSVIESTCKEPFPGWMEGNRMMDPIFLHYGKRQLTGFLVDPNGVLDVVPADMVANAMLAAIANHGMITSSVANPLDFQELSELLYEHYNSLPCMDAKGRPIQVPSMKLFSSMEDFSAHIWRDALRPSGLTQAKYLAGIYEPYTFYGGRFDNSNIGRLMERTSEEEKRKFGFDVGSIDWKDYITNVHIPGLKRHVLKGRGGL
ncbi:fatty acyl-CoA reductase 2 [Pyrus ussuriensis x Pyrus communis]|uniref:Fatty acyl-CoA reductase n=1 Tax=Pyrus ussuriensis x Pyrus communis TaxID=2448454 RepID=A0A5N5HXF1_9ROSA|nr:fatty acyl-CoA reductase 2 [Pyrus ussuriensis x Pyrus communis]